MATEISKPAASDVPEQNLNIHQATDTISDILSRESGEGAREEAQEKVRDIAERRRAKAPPAEEPEDLDDEEPETTDERGGEDEEIDEDQEQEAKEPPKSQDDKDGVAQDTEEIEIGQADLADILGVDEDDLIFDEETGFSLRAKVDGKTVEATIGDLRDSYQLAKTSQQRLQKLSEDRKAFDSEKDKRLKDLESQQQFMSQALQAVEAEYAQNFEKVDWSRLREEDPEAFTRKRMDFDDRMRRVVAFRKAFEEQAGKTKEAKDQDIQKLWNEGATNLEEAFKQREYKSAPKWDESEQGRLLKWMGEQGYTDVSGVTNWQVFKWARDSMLRQQERKEAQKTIKRVIKKPRIKTGKPGAKQAKGVQKKNETDILKQRQRKAAKSGRSNIRESEDLISNILRG